MISNSPSRSLFVSRFKTIALFAIVFLFIACSRSNEKAAHPNEGPQKPSADLEWITEKMIGGDGTVIAASKSSHAFSFPSANLSNEHLAAHNEGDGNFEQVFVQGPGSGHPEFEGLGPAFNSSACIACHIKDGRGVLPSIPLGQTNVVFGANTSLLLRLSIEPPEQFLGPVKNQKTAANEYGAPIPVPGFGRQLFHRGPFGLREDASAGTGQADIRMSYKSRQFIFPDGEQVELRTPTFDIENPFDAPGELPSPTAISRLFQNDVKVSPRIGVPMIGLGLIEAISDEDILKNADPEDLDKDGIRGKPNFVYDVLKAQKGIPYPVSLGRFGWKASTPNLMQQSMSALAHDMGVTNFLFPNENIAGTPLFDEANKKGLLPAPPGRLHDADDQFARSLTVYSQTLGVPARRNVEPPLNGDPQSLKAYESVIAGGKLFATMKCASCHTPSFTTSVHPEYPEFSNQKIYPFSDFLLHDMGDELADNRRDFDAGPKDWRTRPLWGIGMTQTVNPRAGFLHDGRARTLEEAILFHGGEAQGSRDQYVNLSRDDRRALIQFLRSL